MAESLPHSALAAHNQPLTRFGEVKPVRQDTTSHAVVLVAKLQQHLLYTRSKNKSGVRKNTSRLKLIENIGSAVLQVVLYQSWHEFISWYRVRSVC